TSNNKSNRKDRRQRIMCIRDRRKANMRAHMKPKNKIYNTLTRKQKKKLNDNFEKRLTERPATKDKIPETAE
ncbi:hypothetical protein Q2450_26495, partial [Escherichia coli]|nr:hypothetical protein [Escherichia coli]